MAKLASRLAKLEGGAHQATIGDVRQIEAYVADILFAEIDPGVHGVFDEYVSFLSKCGELTYASLLKKGRARYNKLVRKEIKESLRKERQKKNS